MKQPTVEQYQQAKDTIEKLGDQLENNISVHLALMKRFTALALDYAKGSDEHEGTMRALVAGHKTLRQKEQVILDYKEIVDECKKELALSKAEVHQRNNEIGKHKLDIRELTIALNKSKEEVESLLTSSRVVIDKQKLELQLLREQQSLTLRTLNTKPIPKTTTTNRKK